MRGRLPIDVRGDDSDFSPFFGKPQVEGVMKHSRKFPSVKIPRFVSSRTPKMISRWQGNNDTVLDKSCFLDLDLHTDTNNFVPNEVQRGCQSLRSCCSQRIKHKGIMIAIESKCRKVNERGNGNK